MEKLKNPIGQQLVMKIARRMANYKGCDDFNLSKIINLKVDVKNHVISEVMDPFESGRKRFTHKKYKKFKELIEFWEK